nr:MAG TPA: hypothetical protein [Caudoviricetes sp.]
MGRFAAGFPILYIFTILRLLLAQGVIKALRDFQQLRRLFVLSISTSVILF